MGYAECKEQSSQGNVPNKREQNQTCLGYAEREGHLHKENVPNLRFPEFSGEWERIKVSDLLEFYPTNSLSWEQLDYSGRSIFNLHYGLIHKGLPTQVDVSANELPTIKDEYIPRKMSLCQNGDVAFADASEDTNDVAKCIEFANCDEQKIVCGLHTIHGRDTQNKTVTGYKGYAFSARPFRAQIRRLAQGTKIYSINSHNFSECYIGIPCKEEQSKISNLLHSVDLRIATQIKIIEDLKKLKSAISKTILSGNKFECYQTTLGEVADIYQPQTIPTSWLGDKNKYNVYGANGIIGKYSKYNHETSQICIACRGNSCGIVNYSIPKSWITGNAMVINTDGKDVDKRYLYHLLCTTNFNPLISGSGQPQIVRSPLEKMKIQLPNLTIQRNISKVLDYIESKVEIEENICKRFIKQKSGLLSQMFI